MAMMLPRREAPDLVLVVEDDGDVRESIAEVLDREGYCVACAANGVEALAFLRRAQPLPALILLDLMMPVMNGWEFRARQRSERDLAGIPVVVLSGDARAVQEATLLEAAAAAAKPVSMLHLLELVRRLCRPPPAEPSGTPRPVCSVP
jgi:CheY-like chemotaxis protein